MQIDMYIQKYGSVQIYMYESRTKYVRVYSLMTMQPNNHQTWISLKLPNQGFPEKCRLLRQGR